MSPTSYQAAPPRECIIAEPLMFVKPGPKKNGALDHSETPHDVWKLFTHVPIQLQETLIPRGACNRFRIGACANLFEAVAKVPRINPR